MKPAHKLLVYYGSMLVRSGLIFGLLLAWLGAAAAQVTEVESNGERYTALTRNGLTIMLSPMSSHVREFSILQVAVLNGSKSSYSVKPEDFSFERPDGTSIHASEAGDVVNELVQKASRGDVIKLVMAYEANLYGNKLYRSTNGFETRRQSALAEISSAKVKAAAAASAIAFVPAKLAPGQSTDGAVFYPTYGKPVGHGILRVRAAGTIFEFPMVSLN